MTKDYKGVTLLYSKRYDSYCKWDGNVFINDGKCAGAYFHGTEKAANWGFVPVVESEHDTSNRVFSV